MTKNKQAAIWAGVALAAAFSGGLVYMHQQPKRPASYKDPKIKIITNVPDPIAAPLVAAAPSAPMPTNASTTVASSTPVAKTAFRSKPKSVPSVSNQMSYGDAVAKYGNLRIQFSPGCLQATPNRIAVGNGVTIMLDNRSDTSQKITFGGQTYIVGSYNYVLVTLKEKAPPTDLFVNCDTGVNVAEIIVE